MRIAALLLTLVAAQAAQPVVADDRVDVALVLAVDVSLSMDPDEQRAQRDGYLSAIAHPAVVEAIGRGLRGRIALSYVEWGGPYDHRVIVPWRTISTEADAAAFAQELAFAPLRASRGTSISAALAFSRSHLAGAPPADRLVVDVSGDGPNNQGEPVETARDRLLEEGIEINGLPLLLKEPDMLFSIPDLDRYYAACVIGGPGAFVVPVRAEAEFADAIRRKLVLEIAGPPPGSPSGPPAPVPADFHVDCLVGEKLYERWRRSMDWN
jgi:hypothetical protein